MALKLHEMEIEREAVILLRAANFVRFSFIVQNSISYLDLSISENDRNRCVISKNRNSSDWFTHLLKNSLEFIGTEEKCQKIFAPRRNILYILHLDLSKRREKSLKEHSYLYIESRSPHITELEVSPMFYIDTLDEFIKDSSCFKVEKLRPLKLILNISCLQTAIDFGYDSYLTIIYNYIYSSITYFWLFEPFIKDFNVTDWVFLYENKIVADFLLYHKRNVKRTVDAFTKLKRKYFFRNFFLNIRQILTYIDTTSPESFLNHIPSLSYPVFEKVIKRCKKVMNLKRIHLILLTLWIFDEQNETPQRQQDASGPEDASEESEDASEPTENTSEASEDGQEASEDGPEASEDGPEASEDGPEASEDGPEALRLLWSSSTQAYVTFKDVEKAFGGILAYEELTDMYQFYCRSIGENHSCIEPRRLTHFCRATIRKCLYKNKIWIPKGIALLRLPKSFQSFLNLEKQLVTLQ